MAFKIFDYRCEKNHVTEHMTNSCEDNIICSECGTKAQRITSSPAFILDHTFPGKYVKWAKEHEKAAVINNQ